MAKRSDCLSLSLHSVEHSAEREGADRVRLMTNAGEIVGRLHSAETGDAAILWVFGSGGGLGGPAGGLYTRLAGRFRPLDVTSLELDYRRPGDLRDCVLDVLLGVAYLASLGKTRIVLVGHSFGGAVVINAGAVSQAVRAARRGEARSIPSLRLAAAVSFAGVRGAITLAGVLTFPLAMPDGSPFPARALCILIAAGVIILSLAWASISLPRLLAGLTLPPDDSDEDE